MAFIKKITMMVNYNEMYFELTSNTQDEIHAFYSFLTR